MVEQMNYCYKSSSAFTSTHCFSCLIDSAYKCSCSRRWWTFSWYIILLQIASCCCKTWNSWIDIAAKCL